MCVEFRLLLGADALCLTASFAGFLVFAFSAVAADAETVELMLPVC